MGLLSRAEARQRRHRRVRKRLFGSAEQPRLSVFRSNRHIYAQLIDDIAGKTLSSASTTEHSLRSALQETGNTAGARLVGQTIATRAREKGVSRVVFDRGGFLYHGQVKALADAAREGGLVF